MGVVLGTVFIVIEGAAIAGGLGERFAFVVGAGDFIVIPAEGCSEAGEKSELGFTDPVVIVEDLVKLVTTGIAAEDEVEVVT